MSALPCQPVPTIAQRKALHADHAKRYARQYRDVQDAVVDLQVARLRYEAERLSQQPEPVCFVADVEVPRDVINEDFAITCFGVAVLCLIAIALLWGLPV